MGDDLSGFRAEMRRRGVYRSSRRVVFSAERQRLVAKKAAQAPRVFLETAVADTRAKLGALEGFALDAVVSCPTNTIYNGQQCRDACRCGGTGWTTVGILVERYTGLLAFLEATG